MFRREVKRAVSPVLVAVLASAFVLGVTGAASASPMHSTQVFNLTPAAGISGVLYIRVREDKGVSAAKYALRRSEHDRSHVDGDVRLAGTRSMAQMRAHINDHVYAVVHGTALPEPIKAVPAGAAAVTGRVPTFHVHFHQRMINAAGNYVTVRVAYRETRDAAPRAAAAWDRTLAFFHLKRSSQSAAAGSLGPAQ